MPLQRAMPMLGTLLGIVAHEAEEDVFASATQAAFERVAAIHAAMSFHEAGSDLRSLARSAGGDLVAVQADTWLVLQQALEIERRSDGAFNACCAAQLVARGLLPTPMDALPPQAACLGDGIELLDGNRVRVHRTPWIDLGGIAKGHAVDVAVQCLQRAGMRAGWVNAGGDLRAFGPHASPVHVRDPRAPTQLIPVAELSDAACATTAWSLANGSHRHIVGVVDNPPMSVTVFAPRCCLADALTKVVWLRGDGAAELLRECGAQAWVLHQDGTAQRL